MLSSLQDGHLLFLSLLLLSHLDGALCCRPGTPEECHSLPFVPGYKLVGEGYDVVKLERKGAYVFDVYSYLNPAGSCRVCVNHHMGNQLQKLPLYMADWRAQNRCKRIVQSSAHSSVSAVVESASSVIQNHWGVGLDLEYKVQLGFQLAGSKSNVQAFTSSSFKSDKMSLSVNQFSCSNYRFRVSSLHPLSLEFQRDVRALPKEPSPNITEPYRRFIDIYGTHYIRLVDLGGRMNKVTAVRVCLASLNKVSVSQVEECMSMGLNVGLGMVALNVTSGSCSKVLGNHDTATSYEKGYLTHMTEVMGGSGWMGEVSLTEEDSAGFKKWLETLKRVPDILSFSMSPLHELVSNKKVRANMQTAISQYVIENSIKKDDSPPNTCFNQPNVSPECCPLLAGRARLTVFVERGYSIRGDGWFKPEGFAKVSYGGHNRQTHAIRSYDPVWNSNFDFGNVETIHDLKMEVWDDDVWNDDHLGGCDINVQAGGDCV
ncbi:perforin-1-like [Aplochiton taeniatus]